MNNVFQQPREPNRWRFTRVFRKWLGDRQAPEVSSWSTWLDRANLSFARIIVAQFLRTMFLAPLFEHYLAWNSPIAVFITFVLSTLMMSFINDQIVLSLLKIALEILFNYALLMCIFVIGWTLIDIAMGAYTFWQTYDRYIYQAFSNMDCQQNTNETSTVSSEYELKNPDVRPRYQGFMRYLGLRQPTRTVSETAFSSHDVNHARRLVPRTEFVDSSSSVEVLRPHTPFTASTLNQRAPLPTSNQSFLRVTRQGTVFGSYPAAPQTPRSGRAQAVKSATRSLERARGPQAKLSVTLSPRLPTPESRQPTPSSPGVPTVVQNQSAGRVTRSGNTFGYYPLQSGDQSTPSAEEQKKEQ